MSCIRAWTLWNKPTSVLAVDDRWFRRHVTSHLYKMTTRRYATPDDVHSIHSAYTFPRNRLQDDVGWRNANSRYTRVYEYAAYVVMFVRLKPIYYYAVAVRPCFDENPVRVPPMRCVVAHNIIVHYSLRHGPGRFENRHERVRQRYVYYFEIDCKFFYLKKKK